MEWKKIQNPQSKNFNSNICQQKKTLPIYPKFRFQFWKFKQISAYLIMKCLMCIYKLNISEILLYKKAWSVLL